MLQMIFESRKHQISAKSELQKQFVISAYLILQLSVARRPQGMKLPRSQQYRTGGHWSHIHIVNWYRNLHRNVIYEDDLSTFCAVLRGFLNMPGSGRFRSLFDTRRLAVDGSGGGIEALMSWVGNLNHSWADVIILWMNIWMLVWMDQVDLILMFAFDGLDALDWF